MSAQTDNRQLSVADTLSLPLLQQTTGSIIQPVEPSHGEYHPTYQLQSPPSVFAPEGSRQLSLGAPRFYPGRIAAWRGGALYGNVAAEELPGMMAIESGSLTIGQHWGPLTATLYGSVAKYGYFGGLQRSLGVGGTLNYRFSDNIALTIFGAYHSSLHPLTPGMAGYMNTSNFGGFLDYRQQRWGVKLGAQSYRSSITGRWVRQPIVMPYYRLNDKAELGIDIGGILYQLQHGSSFKSGPRNPTIGPPANFSHPSPIRHSPR